METAAYLSLALSLCTLVGIVFLLLKKPAPPSQEISSALAARLDALDNALRNLDRLLREEQAAGRKENAESAAALRTELLQQLNTHAATQSEKLAALAKDSAEKHEAFRQTVEKILREQNESLFARLDAQSKNLREQLDSLSRTNTERLEKIRETLEKSLAALREENAKKLDEMRATVDEKLQSTLEKRLGESFKQVSERLESVHKSLGEMQSVAANVGDLKRVLTNVKTRGTWGEFQLGAILETILLPEQYATNVKPNPRSGSIVEFAIRLPGQEDGDKPLWLPIDAKFPKEDYERLVEASERADAAAVEQAARDLANAVEKSARDIRDKYIAPPHTTDFAILFLPTEGLYAEVLRRPGLADKIQRESRVLIAGPTTLAALLNSLQMGFKTLAIQKRSSEVWKLLGAIKTQFGQFGDLLGKVQKKLDEASSAVGSAANRHRLITSRISKVESLPDTEAAQLLPLDEEES